AGDSSHWWREAHHFRRMFFWSSLRLTLRSLRLCVEVACLFSSGFAGLGRGCLRLLKSKLAPLWTVLPPPILLPRETSSWRSSALYAKVSSRCTTPSCRRPSFIFTCTRATWNGCAG